MKVLKINDNGPGAKGLAELNQYVDDEKKKVRDGVAGEGQGLSEESRIIEESGNENGVREELGHPQVMVLRPQQQVQGQVVRWERFLPVRSLKVLLVESDDSTRHVVSALLRNCSYEVTAVPNGLQAWKILEDLNHQIDLVLTELVMPGLSGFDLLSRITSHQTCQNIPVIMMSSHDSMGIVLKCLSKGAADFLVKPIRKNELKNLWQHVWRKWRSSSGSGSESGIQTQKSIKSKSLEESDNDTGSNDEDDTKSLGSHVRDGSDNGSGTQSSWTKKAVEADSSPPLSPWDQLAEPPDSTCAQVIHSRDEAFASSWVLVPAKEHKGQDNRLDNVSMGKDLEIGLPGHLQSQPEDPNKSMGTKGSVPGKDQSALSDLKKDGQKFDKGESVFGIENDELRRLTVSSDDPQRGSIGSETPENSCYVPKVEDKMIENADELPSLELTLKRMGEVGDVRTNTLDQNVLRHSELSAFTRYNTGATVNHGQAGNVGSCSPLGNSSEPAKKSISDATLPNQNSNSSSNNNDMGSTTNNSFRKPPLVIDKGTSVNYSHPSAFQSVQNSGVSSPHLVISGKASTVLDQQKHNYFYNHHDGDQLQRLQSHDDLSIKKMAEEVSQCGSSNMGRTVIKANAANYGLNGSASGSNHGSNANYGSSAAAKAEGTNVEHDNGIALRDVADDGTGSSIGGRAVVDQNRSAQREAALNKFRQKRKERCFEKRVRYQSRKKLAEQRPRIRGQFVRQVRENKDKDADS